MAPRRINGASSLLGAGVPNAPAQPAVRRVGIQPRVPEKRHCDLGYGDRQGKIKHPGPQGLSMAFGNGSDQVGGACQSQRRREPSDDGGDLPRQPRSLQGFVDWSPVEPSPRDEDMPASGIAGRSDVPLAERMTSPHHADEAVAEQTLRTHLRTRSLPDDPCLQIDACVTKWRAVPVRLQQEAQTYPGRFLADPRDQARSEGLREALAGPQGERPHKPRKIEPVCRAQNRFRILHDPADPLTELDCPRRGDQTPSGPDEQGIARRLTQPRQRPAHRGRAEPQPPGRARYAAFCQKHIEGDEQVEIRVRHVPTVARFDPDVASDARIRCKRCAFCHVSQGTRVLPAPMPEWQGTKSMLKQIVHEKQEPGTEGAKLTPSPRWALVSLCLSMLLSALGTSITNVALPTLADAFDASFQDVQWIVLAYLLAVTTLVVSVGRFGDILGRRRLLLAGIGLFTTASLLCSVAPTLWLLIAARAVQGLGAAIMMALTMASVGETIPKEKTGSAMGLLGTTSAIGTALGPSLGGVLISGAGWQAIFLVNVPLGVLTFLLAYRALPDDRKVTMSERVGFDGIGTLLLVLTLTAYALAMTVGRGTFGPLNMALLGAAILGAGFFVLVEARGASPLIRLSVFRNQALSAGLAMSALVMTVVMATLVVGPFYLSGGLGLDAALVGLVMSTGPLVAALTGVPAGRLVDRFGAGRMANIGLVAAAVGSFALSLMPARFGIPGYIAPLVAVTAGYALFQAANNTAVMTVVSQDERGVVSGMLNLSRNLGLVTGASVMGAVFALASGTVDMVAGHPEAVAAGMHGTFTVAAVLVVVALAISVGSRTRAVRPA